MKISLLKITNVLGVEELVIQPGALTLVEGANASGKTSVLEAIRMCLQGGHDGTLLRNGAERGEIVLVLDDGVHISKVIGPDESTVTVRHPEYGRIQKPAAYLKKLTDALSVNPVEFLTAPARKRVDILLEAIPMKVTADELAFVPEEVLSGKDLGRHALEVLGAIGKEVYDQRTGVNRAAKEKRATIEQMRKTLPEGSADGEWSETFEKTKQEFAELQVSTRHKLDGAKEKAHLAETEERELFSTRRQEVQEELERKIAALRAEADAIVLGFEKARGESLRTITGNKERALADIQGEYQPRYNELQTKLAEAKARIEEQSRTAEARKFIARMESESSKLEDESRKLTRSLEELEALKSKLLANLPVKGLEIRDNELFVSGIPFERVNTSQRVRIAIEIAKLRAGNLGLVCVDGLECFDPPTFEAFKAEALKSNVQFIVSKVSGGQLHVQTEDVETVVKQ